MSLRDCATYLPLFGEKPKDCSGFLGARANGYSSEKVTAAIRSIRPEQAQAALDAA